MQIIASFGLWSGNTIGKAARMLRIKGFKNLEETVRAIAFNSTLRRGIRIKVCDLDRQPHHITPLTVSIQRSSSFQSCCCPKYLTVN